MKPLFFMQQYIITLYTKVADKLVGTNITRFAMKRPLI